MSTDKDVLQLVFLTEKICTALRNGELPSDELRLVRDSALDLLEAIAKPAPSVTHSNGTPAR